MTRSLRCHECGQPATWSGSRPSSVFTGGVWTAPFCERCKKIGVEAKHIQKWVKIEGKS